MTRKHVTYKNTFLTVVCPSADDVLNLKVGDLAPDCFGEEKPITSIFARGFDVTGRAYVCYYTEFGARGSVSNSLKEGEIPRTLDLTSKLSSAEIAAMERQ